MALDPGAARLLRMLNAAGAPAQDGCSIEARRAALNDLAAGAGDRPGADIDCTEMQLEGADGVTPARLYAVRASPSPVGLIVYVHGGGWVAGDLETHAGVCAALAFSSGLPVLAIDYRRAPEQVFPAAVSDVVGALLWAAEHLRAQGLLPSQLVLAGDSAGANIAASACHLLGSQHGVRLGLMVLLCPILDLAPRHRSRRSFANGYFVDPRRFEEDVRAYLGPLTGVEDPRVSPLRLEDLSRFAPVHLHLAEFDPFRDEGLAFARRLTAAGVPVCTTVHAGMIHYFYAVPRAIPKARAILAEVGSAIRTAVDRGRRG
jgi:acetyl esterase/lipase